MIKNDIQTLYSQTKWALAIRGFLGVALGIFILARPLESVAAFALVIAIWALIDGVTNIVRAFAVRDMLPHWWTLLLSGAIGVAFGVASLYYYPALSLSFAVLWASLWLFTAGVIGVYYAVVERRAALPWGATMTLGVLLTAGGILAFVYPGLTLAGLISVIAAVGIVGGGVMLFGAVKLQDFKRDLEKTESQFRDGSSTRQRA